MNVSQSLAGVVAACGGIRVSSSQLGNVRRPESLGSGTATPPPWWDDEEAVLARLMAETARRGPWDAALAVFGGNGGR